MDIAHYRRAETAAHQALRNWRQGQSMLPIVFERVGFPVRVESVADLAPLTDTMQEGRFALYMTELGGLSSADEVPWLVSALVDYARFYAATFHAREVVLPLSTMMAHQALAIKLRPWINQNSRVLEIGAGCGYLPFFIKDRVRAYHQIETTESFYMLQHLVNAWCYRDRLQEAAFDSPPASVEPLTPSPSGESPSVMLDESEPGCAHWPWWLAGAPRGPFDVITSNANLSEMTDNALLGYADLIKRTLAPEGAFIVQCFGGGHENTTAQRMFDVLAGVGLKALFIAGRSPLVVGNGVFVRGQWDGSFGGAEEIRVMDDPRIRAMFQRDDVRDRVVLSTTDVAAMVQDALRGKGAESKPSGVAARLIGLLTSRA
jgi:hypothetical protein